LFENYQLITIIFTRWQQYTDTALYSLQSYSLGDSTESKHFIIIITFRIGQHTLLITRESIIVQ